MIKIKNLYKNFNEKKILENLSLEVNKGDIVTILGRSGSGKTTLLKCIAGFDNEYTGSIKVSKKIGYMFQDDLLLNYLNVYNNITLPMKLNKNINKEEFLNNLNEYSEVFGIKEYLNQDISKLSGGQKQRVAFLRSFLISKDILLLDEPFSKLDDFTKFSIYKWFIDIYLKYNFTCILITHNIDEAILLSNKIYILEDMHIKHKVDVHLEYPRNIADEKYIQIKKNILEMLNITY